MTMSPDLPKSECGVYLVLDSAGLVKVGATAAPLDRFKSLSREIQRKWGCTITRLSWFPSDVAYDIEEEVHRRLR